MDRYPPLLPDNIYHIYNRALGDEILFRSEENYYFFLQRMKIHLLPVMDIYSYALLPNHFHLMVKVKNESVLMMDFELKKKKGFDSKLHSLPDFAMEQVSNLLNSYTKAFNRMYGRMGGLFIAGTKRSEVRTDDDITSFILYLHKNAVHHGLTAKIGEWKFDGYMEIINNESTYLLRDEVFEWFGSKELFIKTHQELKIDRK